MKRKKATRHERSYRGRKIRKKGRKKNWKAKNKEKKKKRSYRGRKIMKKMRKK